MSNARQALGSILTTVSTTANTLTDTVGTINLGVGMLNTIVRDAAARQQIQSKLDMATFEEELVRSKAQDESESTQRVLEYCSRSETHKQLYQQSYDRFNAILGRNQTEPKD